MRLLSRTMRNMRNVNPTKKTQMMINGWNTVWFVSSSVLINWCWSVVGRIFNDMSSEWEWLFTSEICFYHDYYYSFMISGISDEFVFYQFQPFFLLSRQSPPTDWLTLFEVNLVPRAFYLRKWLEDTRLEATLAQGKGRGEEGVLPGVFGGEDEQPGSPYPELISNQICSFSNPFSGR